ncbi:MAG: M1 family metallopeptidase [Bacteroidota bacterium]|jgi:hypothetical protein
MVRTSIAVLFFGTLVLFFTVQDALGSTTVNYFQQSLSYEISVTLDDRNHTLEGSMVLNYQNNSNAVLDTIWFHLWPNAYSSNNTPLCSQMLIDGNPSLFFADKGERGSISALKFTNNGRELLTVSNDLSNEILGIVLHKPLKPGEYVRIETPFKVKIPSAAFSRLGRVGQSYYLTQWFPKPAVFDKDGWHTMPYLNRGEFYSEFADFDVLITVPSQYVVAGSGELQTESEKDFLRNLSLNRGTNPDSRIAMLNNNSSITKTIRYTLKNAHDFAWFADPDFQVVLDTVALSSGKMVSTAIFHTNKSVELWNDASAYAKNGLIYLSSQIGDYPYNTFSVVDGRVSAGGGMEYPSITILNTPRDKVDLERVLIHELGHNWFYGALGSNEREYPWMDEGMNTYFEEIYMKNVSLSKAQLSENRATKLVAKMLGEPSLDIDSMDGFILNLASYDHNDQPIHTRSEDYNAFNYGVIAYLKTAKAFSFLSDYLGKKQFEKCIKAYYDAWSFRHPTPYDLQISFEKTSGQDLNWFFNDFLKSTKPQQISLRTTSDSNVFELAYKSGPKTPLLIQNKNQESVWVAPFQNDTLIKSIGGTFTLNKEYAPLFKLKRVYFNENGRPKWNPLPKIRLSPSLQNKEGKDFGYLIPVPIWNPYDGFMAGIHISNKDVLPSKFEYSIMPLYSTGFNSLSGSANIQYNNWFVEGIIHHLYGGFEINKFGYSTYRNNTNTTFNLTKSLYYYKISPYVGLSLRKPKPWSRVNRTIELKYHIIGAQEPVFFVSDAGTKREFKSIQNHFTEASWSFENSRILDPFRYGIRSENGKDHTKLSVDFNYKVSYRNPKKGFDLRIFVGGFLRNTSERNYNFRMSSWSGSDDYLFEGIYLGRGEMEGILANQMLIRDGGFITPTPLGQSNKWIGAINLSFDNPTPLPIRGFFNIGTYDGIRKTFDDLNNMVMFEGGVSLILVKGIAELHVPVFQSKDIKRTLELNNVKFADRIRFVLDLNQLSFTSLRNRIITSIR